jgi:hypothetical protein
MRRSTPVLLPGLLMALWACNSQGHAAGDDAPAALQLPATIACADAPELRQSAAEDRRLAEASRSDQERIVAGSRATFLVSLAIIAELGCAGPLAGADQPLGAALEAARQADEASSFYVAAGRWTEAGFLATQAIAILIGERTAPPEPQNPG